METTAQSLSLSKRLAANHRPKSALRKADRDYNEILRSLRTNAGTISNS